MTAQDKFTFTAMRPAELDSAMRPAELDSVVKASLAAAPQNMKHALQGSLCHVSMSGKRNVLGLLPMRLAWPLLGVLLGWARQHGHNQTCSWLVAILHAHHDLLRVASSMHITIS
jgi:hypothetical protein